MASIIRNGQRLEDSFVLVEDADPVPANGPVLVSITRWREERAHLIDSGRRVGIWLTTTDDSGLIAADLPHVDPVCVRFGRFNDGRGYTIARLLRERYGYRGEIRAVGEVLRDQIFYLSRVGFDAFQLRADQDIDAALMALEDFSEAYQSSVERPQPLFRRRLLANV